VTKRRARTDEQKQERRQALLDAAWALFQDHSYDEISVTGVTKAAGVAKGTFYLYFKTKEELFMAIMEQLFTTFFDQVSDELHQMAERQPEPEEIAKLFQRSLDAQPGLTRLFAILHPVLEQNIDYDTAVGFKRMLLERIVATGNLLESCLLFLRPGEGAEFMLRAYALVIGIQHVSDPAPVIREAIEKEPDLALYNVKFSDEVSETVAIMLRGLEHINQSEK
jgi:TetR/AcrR family transcriptional regulator